MTEPTAPASMPGEVTTGSVVTSLPVSEQNNANGGLVRLYCRDCRRYGDHLTTGHPPPPVIPDCQGHARFDTLDRAEYLMGCMVEEFGGTWRVMQHGEHFHVAEVPTDA